MTSRKPGRSPASSRSANCSAVRSAGMSVARAITTTSPAEAASGKSSRAGGRRQVEFAAASTQAGPGTLRATRTRGSYKTASKTDQKRLAELKIKLGDPDYMDGAILRIATVLSARLTLR
jgi:hypothetical protein